MAEAPAGCVQLKGSEKHPAPNAKLLGPADPNERFSVTIVLRRRPDGPPMPDLDYYARTPLSQRRPPSRDEFAAKYGASPADIAAVTKFATEAGLTIVETSAVRRTVIVSGTVAQMEKAFGVTLGYHERPSRSPGPQTSGGKADETETYRGREGVVYIPAELAGAIIGVFGLDNRNITQQNGPGDPPSTSTLTIAEVVSFYNWPTTSAAGQTIAIVSLGTYKDSSGKTHSNGFDSSTGASSDLGQYFASLGRVIPKVIIVPSAASSVNATPPNSDSETTQDICIAATVAEGATIAVYFLSHFSNGQYPNEAAWIQLIGRVIHPDPGDLPPGVQPPSVLSTSQFISPGDDQTTLQQLWAVSNAWIDAVSLAFQDAAAKGITVCVTSGDQGSDSLVGSTQGSTEWNILPTPATAQFPATPDGQAHVQYPASDPWALSCGGTTLGKDISGSLVEYVYNDINPFFNFPDGTTGGEFATGGGVSAYFTETTGRVPPWQETANVPTSVNDGHIGRGVPDVAGNASSNSGYKIFVNGSPYYTGGTSAVAPLYAGLIAVLNAALNQNIGFLNPTLYGLGTSVCRAVTGPPGPTSNSLNGITGYPATNPWNACTGWGVIRGDKLLAALQAEYQKSLTIILQHSTFSQDEVGELAGVFKQALFVTVAGLKPSDFPGPGHGITTLSPSSHLLSQWAPKFAAPTGPGGATTDIQIRPTFISSDDSMLGPHAQTFTFTYTLTFTDQGTAAFGLAGSYPQFLAIEASLTTVQNTVLTNFQQIELIKAADPRFSNGADWIQSNDLRVFYVTQGSQMFGAPSNIWEEMDAPLKFIQWIIAHISGHDGTGPNGDTFETTLSPTNVTLSSLPQTTGSPPQNVYNFAIARVRLTSSGTAAPAKKVRVFFRLWQAMSADLAYTPPAVSGSGGSGIASPDTGPYRQWSDGRRNGVKVPLLGISPDGTEYITVPFFATTRVPPSAKMTTQPEDGPNAKQISPLPGGGTQYAYFGCWLDTNQLDPEFPLGPQGQISPDGPFAVVSSISMILQMGGHQCLIAEIVDDDAPIEDGATPQDSDKLAQMNLALLPVSS